MSEPTTQTQATRATIQRGKQIEKLYRDLIALESDISIYTAQIMKYQQWIHDGKDDQGDALDGEDEACLASLIYDLRENIREAAELAWDARKEITKLIDEAIAEANAIALQSSQPLRGAKSVHVSPK
jgi:hypothetical protein